MSSATRRVDPREPLHLDAWLVQDADGRIVDVWAPRPELYGWSASELLGEAAPDFVHPDDRTFAWTVRNRVRTGGTAQTIQVRLRSRGGRWVWSELRFEAVPDDEGRRGLRTRVEIRDVSDEHLGETAAAALLELRRRLDDVWTVDETWEATLSWLSALSGADEVAVWRRIDGADELERRWGDLDLLVAANRGERRPADPAVLDAAWSTATAATTMTRTAGGDRAQVLVAPVVERGVPVAVIELVSVVRGPEPLPPMLATDVIGQLGPIVRQVRERTEKALVEERFRLSFEEAPIGKALVAPDGTFLAANDALCELFGRTRDELLGITFQSVTHPDDLELGVGLMHELLHGRRDRFQIEKRYLRPDGEVVWALLSVSLVRRPDGSPLHLISQVQDITARKIAEEESHRSEARFRAAFDHSPIGKAMVRVRPDRSVELVEANAALRELIPPRGREGGVVPLVEVLGSHVVDLLARQVLGGERFETEIGVRGDGSVRTFHLVTTQVGVDAGGEGGADPLSLVQLLDVTDERAEHSRLRHAASHDELTRLPNRVHIGERIRRAQLRSERTGRRLAVLFVDLDGFKQVNDEHGHAAGDEVLVAVADAIGSVSRPHDSAARLGGDEFVVLCEDLDPDGDVASQQAVEIADRLHEAIGRAASRTYAVSASIGVRVVLGATEAASDLLHHADEAMYAAKRAGTAATVRFDDARLVDDDVATLADDLRRALDDGALDVAFQPLVDIRGGRVHGDEVLLRWTHPDLGPVAPHHVLAAAARSAELDRSLLRTVVERGCAHATSWAPHRSVGFNVSAGQVGSGALADTVLEVAANHGLDTARIGVELTEASLLSLEPSGARDLHRLHEAGVRIGIDDFGADDSSLALVRRLPIGYVKIDRAVTAGVVDRPTDRAIASAVVAMGRALDLVVVAEGVETVAQADVLADLGCRFAQGYLFGHPRVVGDPPG